MPPDAGDIPWYEAIEFRAFVDAYLSVNYNFPKPQTDANAAVRAYDIHNGFALSWAGVDATYPADPVGGTLSLRFGPTADRIAGGCLAGTCDAEAGLTNVKQAYASFRPGGAGSSVVLDFGKFDTPYGAEVAESQDNLNYTRGVVYWFTQPLFHTGLRLGADLTDSLNLQAILVNGYNNTLDANLGKSLGLKLGYALPRSDHGGPLLQASLGYLIGPEREDFKRVDCPSGQHFDSAVTGTACAAGAPLAGQSQSGLLDRPSTNFEGLRHLVDGVVSFTPNDQLTVVANGDLAVERLRDELDEDRFVQHLVWGVMLGARYAFLHEFAVAARGEYLRDPDGIFTGFAGNSIALVSGTLTFDYRPADFLVLRLDNRLDWSSHQLFKQSVRDTSGILPTTTLGVVATTD